MSEERSTRQFIGWIATILVVSFCSGFLIGLSEHRSGQNVSQFVNDHLHLEFKNERVLLIFQCGNKSGLSGYDLLADDILIDQKAVEARLDGPISKLTQSELFATTTSFGMGALGMAFNFSDQLKSLKARKSKWSAITLILLLGVIPPGYLGYRASEFVTLECFTSTLYEYLKKPENWKRYQFKALKSLYVAVEHCIPRHVSHSQERNQYKRWLALLSNEDGEFQPVDWPSHAEELVIVNKLTQEDRSKQGIGWGDSIYFRLCGGENALCPADPKIDGNDFKILLKQERACHLRDVELKSRLANVSIEELFPLALDRSSHQAGDEKAATAWRYILMELSGKATAATHQ